MNAGRTRFGSTSFTFLVRRIFAAFVFGAQLCSARAGSEDDATHRQGEQRNWPADDGAVESDGVGKDHARLCRA